MSTTALAQFLEIKSGGSRIAAYQNYWPGQTVNGYTHYPFTTEGIVADSNGGQTSFSVVLPATREAVTLLEDGIANSYIGRIEIYQFDPPSNNTLPSTRTLVAQFDGEFIGGQTTQTEVTLTLGSSLDPVGAQIPPRTFTSTLVGELPRF